VNKTCLCLLACAIQSANGGELLLPIEVSTPEAHFKATEIYRNSVTSDTASLLKLTPGVSLKTGGGLSSLPVIHGLADDRVNITIDGASITSSCSNHMNPALSYIDPSKVGTIDVIAGITPVSQGGDSIGGSIIVKSKDLIFTNSDDKLRQDLNLKTFFKSNNENQGASLNYEIASRETYFSYFGFDERANNYLSGNGKRLKSTLYNQNNQAVTIGRDLGEGVLSLKLTRAVVPYQGFINQHMDVQDNVSNLGTINFKGTLGKALVESSAYYQHTNHKMDIISSERLGSMPMYTRSDEAGFKVKASFEFSPTSLLTLGIDFNRYHLDDWWPPLPGIISIMGPKTFESINNGKRDRLGIFIESETDWNKNLSTVMGIRSDMVFMNTGNVQGYNNSDNLPVDAAAFNTKSHSKQDNNIDATLLTKLKISSSFDIELGLAQKSRSPNLYERYAWAGSVTNPANFSTGAAMDMSMINWFGDGNGYVGDIDLRPEVARKISTSFIAHDEKNEGWEAKLTSHYSEINNFIDADLIGSSMGNNFLKFANHDAVIFGADFYIKSILMKNKNWGDLNLKIIADYTRGYRKDGKANLYHLMPFNGKIAIQYSNGKWKTDLVTHLVNDKDQVNELRLEPTTGKYALLDFGVSYRVSKLLKIDLGITNVFDLNYGLPLGGVDLVNYPPASRTTVAGMGRSINTSVNLDFF
jgi:iron complex outermembrane receptor protein